MLVNNIKVFSGGQKAIDFLIANATEPDSLPEIIFLDLNIPEMDGFEFLAEYIRQKPRIGKKINIYVLTSLLVQRDHDRIKSIDIVLDFIEKPFTREKFKNILEALMEKPLVGEESFLQK